MIGTIIGIIFVILGVLFCYACCLVASSKEYYYEEKDIETKTEEENK